MKCYFDGSHADGPDGQHWLTLAGFVARDSFWSLFDTEWKSEVLQKREPYAPYLHMTDLLTGNKCFKGWSAERRRSLVMDAVEYLQSCSKQAFRAVTCTIDTAARAKLLAQGYSIRDPHVVCAECAMGVAFASYYERHSEVVELARVYFDRSEKFMHPLRHHWQRQKKKEKSSPIIADCFWGLVVDIASCEMDKTPALQAADLLAWATSRQHTRIQRPYLYLAEIMRKVIPYSWLTLDEDALRSAHEHDLKPPKASEPRSR